MPFSAEQQTEILALFTQEVARLFPRVRIPELPPFSQFRELSFSDRLPVYLTGQNKTVHCDIASLKLFIETGGDVAIEPVLKGDTIIHRVTVGEAGGNSIYEPVLAGKSFFLRRYGVPVEDYEILSAGGATLPGYELTEGELFDMQAYELHVGPSNGSSGNGFITGEVAVSSNLQMSGEEHAGKLIKIRGGSQALEIILPALNELPDYSIIPFEATISNTYETKLQTTQGQNIYMNGRSYSAVYIRAGETAWFYRGEDGWYIIAGDLPQAYRNIGKIAPAFKIGDGELSMTGQALSRTQFNRFWEEIQTYGAAVIDEGAWQSSPLNRTKFSSGDGATTFRLPNWTGLFVKGVSSDAGRHEAADAKITYLDTMGQDDGVPANQRGTPTGVRYRAGDGSDPQFHQKQLTAGTETRPENVGVLWVIKY